MGGTVTAALSCVKWKQGWKKSLVCCRCRCFCCSDGGGSLRSHSRGQGEGSWCWQVSRDPPCRNQLCCHLLSVQRGGRCSPVLCECRGPAVCSEEQLLGVQPDGLSLFPALQGCSFHRIPSPFPCSWVTQDILRSTKLFHFCFLAEG